VTEATSALADRHTIAREIGAGGTTVYLARHLKHDRKVRCA